MRTEISPILQRCTSGALDISCYKRNLTPVRKRLIYHMLVASAYCGQRL